MPRAHLSKRLPDAEAIRLFAEHHIVHVRRRKNGEIVAVKHSTFGWISPQQYYALQKSHELLPILEKVIEGGYRAKQMLWSTQIEVLGFSAPIGAALPVLETFNLLAELSKEKKDPGMIALRAYALAGPFGDVIQIADMILTAVGFEAGILQWAQWASTPEANRATGPGSQLQGAR